SLDMVTGLMGTLKAGGAYLPIQPGLPEDRVRYMLEDSGVKTLLTTTTAAKGVPFTALRNFEANSAVEIAVTPPRSHIKTFDRFSRPDRSLLALGNYKDKIGMASVSNAISLQTTRGCPYECLYCHKIWSKKHVYRSAESIYDEIEYYYKKGVTNFAAIDDCFNLNKENSAELFRLIVKNKLKLQFFFPNGLRGDIMTPGYIDLMAEAGCRGINLSLETASPRLQKLLKKNLDLDKFRKVVEYIALQHPEIMLEMATMHGFPSETEEEAQMTLDFIKEIKWIHFPYIHILKIFPNTEMEEFALSQGISKEDIIASRDRAFHELPETLPFPKSFTRKYQADFLNSYFLNKERLEKVLPVQMNILDESALTQKYNAYLPAEIKSIRDVIEFAGLENVEIPAGYGQKKQEETGTPSVFSSPPKAPTPVPGAKRILFLDLSQHFSTHDMLYKVSEQPLGALYLLTHLKERFGAKIDGRIYKSGVDFDSFEELRKRVEEYQPQLIGIRTLTFFKDFFHETAAHLRQWSPGVPIITGGPYASSDYDTLLKDNTVDIVCFGEGEYTLGQLVEEMLANQFEMPSNEVLKGINGIAYVKQRPLASEEKSRQVLYMDRIHHQLEGESPANHPMTPGGPTGSPEAGNLAYVMYTSGSTGRPKGVMVEHRQVNNCIAWMQNEYALSAKDRVLQRTDLTFDPSVWEIFRPLYVGASLQLITEYQSKDGEYLLRLMSEETALTEMYSPAPLVNIMTALLESKTAPPDLTLPRLFIGAESITVDTVKTFYSYYRGEIVNTYGPTECTINNTFYPVHPGDIRGVVPIGKPVANNRLYILGKEMELMPLETPGEICIAGDSVARGYINNREKTAQSFVPNPFGKGKLYKSGDIGKWLEDGNIEIMGRVDEQIKIRGYRIEPGEINSAFSRYPGIEDQFVTVKGENRDKPKTQSCTTCGITTDYPGVAIEDRQCTVCRDMKTYKPLLDEYFQTPEQLLETIKEANRDKKSPYDCLLLYSGGRGSAYALYQLADMGLKVLAATYDNGYLGKGAIDKIKKITASLNVDHVVLTHPGTDKILAESMKNAHTVCKGCFLTSSSLAARYAYENDIKLVVGATLSRGQIIENKLFMFMQQGITDVETLMKSSMEFQKNIPGIEKKIFDLIDIDVVKDGTVGKKVKVIDFYRYNDITNDALITWLNHREPYWKKAKNYAVYSTNCPIKQIGDYAHYKENGHHFYGGATSWEKRLGHLTKQNIKEDLHCRVTEKGYRGLLKRIGGQVEEKSTKDTKYLCAYYVAGTELNVSEVRVFLAKLLPDYMIPSHFIKVDKIPLLSNGKIDKGALPHPQRTRAKSNATYVPPKSDMETEISKIWKDILDIEQTGIHDNFFDLGGTSMHIIQVGSKLKEAVGTEVPVVTMFSNPTISTLANHLEDIEKDTPVKQPDRTEIVEQSKNRLMRSKQRRKRVN
ncbi:MAG: AMP-binding protein, partial [bacterium]|nr:AMP-binding protein [bacterium]